MGPRGAAVALAAAVVLVVVVRAGSHRPPPAKAPAEQAWPVIEAEEAPTTATTAAVPSTTSTASTTSAESAAGVEEQRAAAALENAEDEDPVAPADQWRALLATDAPRPGLYRLIKDSASSDLPPPVAARAATTGSRFVVADVTGVGREAFPGWWGERPPVPVAATARVLAAGAASYGSLVQVVVVWDGTASDGSALGERTTTVVLDSTNSDVFIPVHPGEVG